MAATLGTAFPGGVPSASARVLPPITVDGPSADGLILGNVAMAPDGTGGVVYAKTAGGVPHVFVSRYDGGWGAPIRVDWDQPFDASQPRVAAGRNGRLLVVWVTQVATVDGKIRRGLFSASLGPGASGFGPSLLVDGNVGDGAGVDPSLAGTVPGKAAVAYRVVTYDFPLPPPAPNLAVQLRPGDVMADIRIARLGGDRWSRLGAVNRFSGASMRPPGATNGPKVAIGANGGAVVAWQEPDATGTARVWMRRITGTTVGPVLRGSPEAWGGRPVGDDATAFGLDVTAFDQARLAVRIDGSSGSSLAGQRMFLTTLGTNYSTTGKEPTSPELVDGVGGSVPPGPLGPPAVAASDDGGGDGSLRLVFAAGAGVRQVGVDQEGKLLPPEAPAGPRAVAGTPTVAALNPEGGGVTAYQALDGSGLSTVAVRQEYPAGGSQTGLLYGPLGGPVSQLAGAGSGVGDALLAFRQGESGRFAIIVSRVAAPPAKFEVRVPERWVRPRRAKVRWAVAPSAAGGVTYGLMLDGRVVKSGLKRRQITPSPALLGNGVRRVQVVATDQLGQTTISRPVRMRVDGQPPLARVRVMRHRDMVSVKLSDPQSGIVARATRVQFGNGVRERGGAKLRHRYAHGGRYTIRLRARDKAGNPLTQRVRVVVR